MKKLRYILIAVLISLALLTIFTDVIPKKAVFLISLLGFAALTFVPVMFKNISPDFLPNEIRYVLSFIFQYSLIVFVCLSLVLGTYFRFYEDFIWWDLFLHLVAGIIFTFPGYCLVYKGTENAKNYMAFLMPFFVSMTASTLWEIYEFTGDMLFKMHMQGSGISDTMEDLTACFVAAVITSVGLYFLSRKYNKTRD